MREICLSKLRYHGNMSFRDKTFRKGVFLGYCIRERRHSKMYLGKASFLDMMSRKDSFPWHHILKGCLSVISHGRKTSFQSILSWKDAIHNNTIWETSPKYQGILSLHNNLSWKRDNVDGHFKLPYSNVPSARTLHLFGPGPLKNHCFFNLSFKSTATSCS